MKDAVVMPRRLTAENGAKALLIGEFKEELLIECNNCNEDGFYEDDSKCTVCDGTGAYYLRVYVTWDTIKAIYDKAVEHLEIK